MGIRRTEKQRLNEIIMPVKEMGQWKKIIISPFFAACIVENY